MKVISFPSELERPNAWNYIILAVIEFLGASTKRCSTEKGTDLADKFIIRARGRRNFIYFFLPSVCCHGNSPTKNKRINNHNHNHRISAEVTKLYNLFYVLQLEWNSEWKRFSRRYFGDDVNIFELFLCLNFVYCEFGFTCSAVKWYIY